VLFWLLPLLTWQPVKPQSNQLWFTLLDVGQGLSAVIQTAHHVLVYDTGARFSPTFNAGSSVLVPYLQRQGIKQVDKLVISHADNDHSGGASALLKAMPVKQIQTSALELFTHYHAQPCNIGQNWQWDGVTFTFLYPPSAHSEKTNDSSCVLAVQTGNQRILLTGDIEKGSERYLLELMPAQLTANILVVPHHGSRTSSTTAFVKAVHPEYALFAVGYHNRYRLPNVTIVERYRTMEAKNVDSIDCGAMQFKLDGKSPIAAPKCYRQQHRHYWNAE
jgi:competence protein ComEC